MITTKKPLSLAFLFGALVLQGSACDSDSLAPGDGDGDGDGDLGFDDDDDVTDELAVDGAEPGVHGDGPAT